MERACESCRCWLATRRGPSTRLAIEPGGEYVVSQGFLRDGPSGAEQFGSAFSDLRRQPVGDPAGDGVGDFAVCAWGLVDEEFPQRCRRSGIPTVSVVAHAVAAISSPAASRSPR